jgi:hypothetical protein
MIYRLVACVTSHQFLYGEGRTFTFIKHGRDVINYHPTYVRSLGDVGCESETFH